MATLAIDASTAQALQLLLKLQKDYREDGIKKLLFGPLSVESTFEKPPDNPDPKVVIQNTTSNFSAIKEESFHPDPDVSPSFSRLI